MKVRLAEYKIIIEIDKNNYVSTQKDGEGKRYAFLTCDGGWTAV